MKNLFLILFVLIGFVAKAQFPSQQTPTQFSTGWFKQGWHQADSGHILSNRLPNFTPRLPGTIILYQQAGVDSSIHYYNGGRWLKLSQFDSTSLSNRINLKLNISDTSAMLSPYLRKVDTTNKWVQDVYSRNDSLFKVKNGIETFVDTFGGGGGGSGTVTSVGLSLPSAFNVTPSSITTSGTFAVTGAGTTAQYIRGNGTLATTDTGMLPNFYLKVRGLLSGSSPITFNQTTGIIGIANANASGTKGAASFTTSFSDNGSGVIDLADLVSAGSCTGCTLNIDAKGRIISYSTGAGGATDNVNIGAGFRPVNVLTQEMRTYFAGFGTRLDTVSNADGITWSADTTRSTGLPSYYYVDSLVGTVDASVIANNGLSNEVDSVQLGQAVSEVGNPAALHNDREIPLNGFRIGLSGTGSFGIGTTAPSLSYRMTVVGAGSTAGINVSTATATGINVSSTNTGVSSFSSTGTAVNANSSGGAGTYAIVGGGGIGGSGGRFHTTFAGGDASPVVLELERLPTGGGVTNGAGFTIMFKNAFTSGATGNESGRITNYFSNAVSGSQTSAFGFHLVNNGVSARKALLAGSGQWIWDGYPALPAQTDTTTYKPVALDGSGNVVKMAGWYGAGGGSGGASSVGDTVIYLSRSAGVVSDADISAGSIAFGTDNTTAVQNVLDIASHTQGLHLIWDVRISTTGLRIGPNTYIEALPSYGAILRDNSDKPLFRNRDTAFGREPIDSNIKVVGGIWNGNSYNSVLNPAQAVGTSANGTTAVFSFYGVRNLIVRDFVILRQRTYAIAGNNLKNALYENGVIDAGDGGIFSDGVHFDGNSEHCTARNLKIRSIDDAVGLNADDAYDNPSSPVYGYFPSSAAGPISDIQIENIFLDNGQFGVRILSGSSRVDNIRVKNITGNTIGYAFIMDNFWQDTSVIINSGVGNVGEIQLENIDVNITGVPAIMAQSQMILLRCNAEKVLIKDMKRYGYEYPGLPTVRVSGAYTNINSLVIDGYDAFDTTIAGIEHILIEDATINSLTLQRINIKRLTQGSGLMGSNNASINKIQINNALLDSVNYVYFNSSSTVNSMTVANVNHISRLWGTYNTINNSAGTITSIAVSNYSGSAPTMGTFGSKIGDAFPATSTQPGYVTTAAQSFAGNKEFVGRTLFTGAIQVPMPVENSFIDAYTSAASNDALLIRNNSNGATLGIQNSNAAAFSGIEYLSDAGVSKVFTGLNNANGQEYRINNFTSGGYDVFLTGGTEKLRINNTGGISLFQLAAPISTYNVLVHGLTDSVVYQVPVSALGLGTVTSFSFTDGGGFDGTVSNATTTPALSIIPSFSGLAYSDGSALGAATVSNLLEYNSGTLQFNDAYMSELPNTQISLKSRMKRLSFTASDANFTTLSTRQEGFFILPDITANRTFTMFSGTAVDGVEFYIYNGNTSGTFSWSFTGITPQKASDGTSVSNLVNGVLYHLLGMHDGTNAHWIIVNQ